MAAGAFTLISQPLGATQGIAAAKAQLAKQGFAIACLELAACHMATNLATNMKEALQGYPVNQVHCWSQSSVALHWIRRKGEHKQFVHEGVRRFRIG